MTVTKIMRNQLIIQSCLNSRKIDTGYDSFDIFDFPR